MTYRTAIWAIVLTFGLAGIGNSANIIRDDQTNDQGGDREEEFDDAWEIEEEWEAYRDSDRDASDGENEGEED